MFQFPLKVTQHLPSDHLEAGRLHRINNGVVDVGGPRHFEGEREAQLLEVLLRILGGPCFVSDCPSVLGILEENGVWAAPEHAPESLDGCVDRLLDAPGSPAFLAAWVRSDHRSVVVVHSVVEHRSVPDGATVVDVVHLPWLDDGGVGVDLLQVVVVLGSLHFVFLFHFFLDALFGLGHRLGALGLRFY